MLDTKFWHKYFKVYDVLNLVIPYQDLLNEIMEELDIKKNDLILDAGVGTGNLAMLLGKRGARIIGLDFSKEALNIYKSKNPKAEIILADLTKKLPFVDNYFDKIVSNNTIYNIPREKRLNLILEFRRILKFGGKIVISNIHKNFKPVKIYAVAIKENIKRSGFLNTIKLMVKMFIPTIKIFYYNAIIQKEHKYSKQNLFGFNEQKNLLRKTGFRGSYEKNVYAEQAFLAGAYKSNL